MSEQRYFERLMTRHCASVLLHTKPASMFHVNKNAFSNISALVQQYNTLLQKYSFSIKLFQKEKDYVTIFVYQEARLKRVLTNPLVSRFIQANGYPNSFNEILQYLDYRLTTYDHYPHEIGIFLGYPYHDVIGFIKQKPCLHCGYWKVYHNKEAACRLFQEYDDCFQKAKQFKEIHTLLQHKDQVAYA